MRSSVELGRFALYTAILALGSTLGAQPQQNAQTQAQLRARRDSLERELQRIAIVDRKLMIPMRDGLRMQADVYRTHSSANQVSMSIAHVCHSR